MVFEDLEPLIGHHFVPCCPWSLVSSFDRVTQVVMDGLFHPFHFVGKKVILNTLGRIARSYVLYIRREGEFFTIPMVFALEDSI